MMDHNENPAVLVGTDGSQRAASAIRYAALEATRLGTTLSIVHSVPDYVPLAPMRPLIPDDLQAVGRTVLSGARKIAEEAVPGCSPRTTLVVGDPATELASLGADARLLVLGHESTVRWGRVFTGAVTMDTAARATCPVLSVPDDWTAPDGRREAIVVGYKTAHHDTGLLEHAFATAAAHGARLTILHAWELQGFYDDIIVRRTHDADWNRAAAERIEAEIADLRVANPDVAIDVRVVHKQPAHALREMSSDFDLLMLARRGNGHALSLGGTARALLRETACPVEIVPPRPTGPTGPDLELESAGAPLR